jgi:hypothetical protein
VQPALADHGRLLLAVQPAQMSPRGNGKRVRAAPAARPHHTVKGISFIQPRIIASASHKYSPARERTGCRVTLW